MCLLKVWKLLLLRMRMPKSENAFENKSQVTLQRWPEKMEDEKGLVAREWLYTKVRWCQLSSWLKLWCWRGQHLSFCWYWVLTVHWTESFHADDGWMKVQISFTIIDSKLRLNAQTKRQNEKFWIVVGYSYIYIWHDIVSLQIIDASQKKYCGKLCGLVLAGGNSIKSASINISL